MQLPAGVVFDLDDTLLDTAGVARETMAALCDALRRELPDVTVEHLDARWHEPQARLYQRVLDREIDFDAYRRAHMEELIAPLGPVSEQLLLHCLELRRLQVDRSRLLDGAVALLDALRAGGVRTSLLTNGPSDLQRRKLELVGLAEHLDGIAISEEVGAAKPDRRAFAAALAAIDCSAADAVMVGDNFAWDIDGALGAGMMGAVWIALDGEPARELPDRAIRANRLADVPAAIGTIVAGQPSRSPAAT